MRLAINAAYAKAVSDADLKKKLNDAGIDVLQSSPEEMSFSSRERNRQVGQGHQGREYRIAVMRGHAGLRPGHDTGIVEQSRHRRALSARLQQPDGDRHDSSRFHASPLRNATRYEPVRSKIQPDIQPPSAMPNSVAIMHEADAATPASCGEKYSRTMMAYIGTMPPWNRPNSAEIDVERQRGRQRTSRAAAPRPAGNELISSVVTPPIWSAMKPEAMRLTRPTAQHRATASRRRAPRRSRDRRNRPRYGPAASPWRRSRRRRQCREGPSARSDDTPSAARAPAAAP